MKVALFCAEPLSIFRIIGLLPDNTSHIISTSGIDFNAELVANSLGLPFSCFCSAEEAIQNADFVFTIWNGTSKEITSALRCAKKAGKQVMFSFL